MALRPSRSGRVFTQSTHAMNQILETLKYFETAPLEDCKYAHEWLKRIISSRSAEVRRARDAKNGWRARRPRKLDDADAIESRRRERRERSTAARAEKILTAAGRAMRTREIADGLAEDGGEPRSIDSVRMALAKEVRRGENARIVKLDKGVYALRGWAEEPTAATGVSLAG